MQLPSMPAQLMCVCMHQLYICVSLSLVMHCQTYMPRLYTSHTVTSLDSPSEASAKRSFRNSQDSDCVVILPSTADTRKAQCTTRTRRSLCRTSATAECVVTIYFRKIFDYTNKIKRLPTLLLPSSFLSIRQSLCLFLPEDPSSPSLLPVLLLPRPVGTSRPSRP